MGLNQATGYAGGHDFSAAFFGALIISLTSWLLNLFIGGDGRFVFIKKADRNNGDRWRH